MNTTKLQAEIEMNGHSPRVHPNGFIQLDLDCYAPGLQQGHSGGYRRLHVWNPPGIELPRQPTRTAIHDHVFDMQSTVVVGKLTQVCYALIIGSGSKHTHQIYRADYNGPGDSTLQPTGITGALAKIDEFQISAGGNYTQPAFSFHDSVSQGTVVTVMEKTKIHEGDASVLCEIGKEPDEFDRRSVMSEAEIWEAIWRSFNA